MITLNELKTNYEKKMEVLKNLLRKCPTTSEGKMEVILADFEARTAYEEYLEKKVEMGNSPFDKELLKILRENSYHA
jgi:hypothetical protein